MCFPTSQGLEYGHCAHTQGGKGGALTQREARRITGRHQPDAIAALDLVAELDGDGELVDGHLTEAISTAD